MSNTQNRKDAASIRDDTPDRDAGQPPTPLVYPAKPNRKSRRFKGTDEIDVEYAEEFEDAFYGEGM